MPREQRSIFAERPPYKAPRIDAEKRKQIAQFKDCQLNPDDLAMIEKMTLWQQWMTLRLCLHFWLVSALQEKRGATIH